MDEFTLRGIAARHGLTPQAAADHARAVWDGRHGNVSQLPAISEAWESMPGTYTYRDAARTMADALTADNRCAHCNSSVGHVPGCPYDSDITA
jgi:hypothetical protein